jgi:hypothetical protein
MEGRDDRVTIAHLEERVQALQASFEHLRDEVNFLSRGVVHRLIWVIIALALALAGKDVASAL